MDERRHCAVHEEYIKSITALSGSIQNLNIHVDWLMRIGKWSAATALTLALFIGAGMATFAYKASDVNAQVLAQSKQIEMLQQSISDIKKTLE